MDKEKITNTIKVRIADQKRRLAEDIFKLACCDVGFIELDAYEYSITDEAFLNRMRNIRSFSRKCAEIFYEDI